MDYSTFGLEGNWYQLIIAAREFDLLVGDIATTDTRSPASYRRL